MNAEDAATLRRLLTQRPVAALATLHQGEPAVSMVPFVLQPGQGRLLIHVSRLATHTADLLAHPRVAVLVADAVADGAVGEAVLALPRASLQAEAQALAPDAPDLPQARADYLARLPEAEPLFGFGDFQLVALRLRSIRLVAGFGRATALAGPALSQWLAGWG